MPLEMRKNNGEIVIRIMRADEIFLKVLTSLHRQSDLSVGIHDIDRGDGRKSMIPGRFQVILRSGPPSAVSGVAFHDGAVHFPHQIADQGRLQEIMAARFAGRKFDGHFAFRLAAQRFVNLHEIFRSDLREQINFRRVRLFAGHFFRTTGLRGTRSGHRKQQWT